MTKLILVLVLLFTLFAHVPASGQSAPQRTESPVVELGQGYELKLAESNGVRAVLVKFPERCLADAESYMGCTKVAIGKVFKPQNVLSDLLVGEDADGKYVYFTVRGEGVTMDLMVIAVKDEDRVVGVGFVRVNLVPIVPVPLQ